ncbi:MAG: precorrin-6y C5,15-methyltransferase (decarboxylating) subunit CbiE [Lachnospiraceae bacterium]|nr:precorrin-6y C5,15-methyltransferase (decarboxylating) subunit CbiE [Lachnospiraceae bacterium]
MKELLIFAGTTEGRNLSELLSEAGIAHTLCVATEYGQIVLKSHPLVTVHQGRLDSEQIRELILAGDFAAVVDATHPYAKAVTSNIKTAMEGLEVPYLRLSREPFWAKPEMERKAGDCSEKPEMERKAEDCSEKPEMERKAENCLENVQGEVVWFNTLEECREALQRTEGNILLTTGSKELDLYCNAEEIKSRLYVRVLPGIESITACMEHGICGKQIIAMQGPFSAQMNEAVIRQYEIRVLVTKESGRNGGFWEKLEAAKRTGVRAFVIGRPEEEEGLSFAEVCEKLEKIFGQKILSPRSFEITIAGVGMGSPDSLTREVQEAIADADILLGAERMLAPYQPKLEKRPFYGENQILPYLKQMQKNQPFFCRRKVTVLISGDSGFYSGCRPLFLALQREIEAGELQASLRILPGISSVAALASRIGESYQDAAVYSMHGKELPNLVRKIRRNSKTFLLMSGVKDMNRLGELLENAGMQECEIAAGYQLSYEDEQVKIYSPKECRELRQEGLYTCMVRNPRASSESLTHGRADKEFIRGEVPMTKEEVREISICKLKLYPGAVLYDIGSGTGSIAVEAAGLSDTVRVCAVEQKKEALSLIRQNREKFELENISVTETMAPEGLSLLPKATHAFIGGSGGQLKGILNELYRINPQMRVVINAVSMETFCEIRECLTEGRVKEEEMIQVQVSRSKKAGNHHLMLAENPVWICAFEFDGK